MSDPRMIPADEAKQLRENTKNLGPWWPEYDDDEEQWDINWENHLSDFSVASQIGHAYGEGTARLFAAAPDLAHTVERQAAQIERVREAVSRIEKKAENSNTEWREGLKSNQHLEGYADGLDIALAEIEQALGDTDD